MKKIAFLALLSFLVFFQFSCEEVGPNVNLGGGGNTTGGTQARNILIEEFTGVHCTNCPEGSEVIESLKNSYGSQLIPISIHSGFFSDPYPESTYDFRTSEGDAINDFLGSVSAWPAAAVNRTVFEGASSLIVADDFWPGNIATEVAVPPAVEVELTKSYDANTRVLGLTVDLNFVESVSDPLLISVMITENNLVDLQKTPTELLTDYVHKHVLRGMMTNATGDAYTGGTSNIGDTGSQSFSLTLPNDWIESNCEIVAFVHSATDKRVLQANSVHLAD